VTRTRRAFSGFFLALAGLATAAPAARAEETGEAAGKRYARIHVIDFEGEIEPALTAYTQRRIREAEQARADLIVFRIESPGGRVDVTKELADRIVEVEQGVRTIAWIPEYAYSGAALVAISCDEIVMGPKAFLGDAQPGTISTEGWHPIGEKGETVIRAWVRGYAADNGYPVLLAEKLISQDMEVVLLEDPRGARQFVLGEEWRDAGPDDLIAGTRKKDWKKTRTFSKGQLLTMTAAEARDLGFASRVASDEDALLDSLRAPGAVVVRHSMTASEKAARWLLGVVGVISGILMLTALLTIWQGIGTHSIVGAVALVLLVLVLTTADLAQGFPIFLIAVGLLLLLAEAFLIPGFGFPGILGILCLVAGLLFLGTGFRPGDAVTFDSTAVERFALQLLATFFAGGLTIVFLARVFPSAPFGRKLVLAEGALPARGADPAPSRAGAAREGVAVTPLRPAGTARVGDDLVDVVTEGDFVDAGARVRVVRVEGSRVVVRPVAG